MKKDVLGIKIDDMILDQVVAVVKKWLKGREKHYIVTPNPEIVVMAQDDLDFKKAINNADLAIPDGAGLQLSTDIVCHTPGIDLMEQLIKLSAEKGFTTGFLGGIGEVAKEAAERLQKKYKNLKVTFAESGGEVSKEGKLLKYPKSLKSLKTDLLFVAFGPPKQEKWIYKNLGKLDVKVAMGVGGSFDYLSGKLPRAPKIVRDLGFEWLFRLIIQPMRIKRQLALIKYIWLLTGGK